MTIFKACDVRGIVGQQWDAEDARRIGLSLGGMLRSRRQSAIVVGGDFRRSTPRLKTALSAGLCAAGIHVHDVGQVPTPVVQFAARQAGCRNLAIVTASHNPGRYNGIKFLVDGGPPVPALVAELEAGCAQPTASSTRGRMHRCDVVPDYQQWVVSCSESFVDECLARINNKKNLSDKQPGKQPAPIKVVVDTMGGAFTGLAPQVLSAAGYEVVSVDDQLDPDFARRDPNPAIDANLHLVVNAVTQQAAELGCALDGDGDRVIFVDDRGTIARPEQMAALLMTRCLGPCTVIYDLKCASLVARTARQMGGNAIMQPSGHGYIKRKLLEQDAELGIEVSGHHFFGHLDGGDDGLFTALVVLRLLSATGTRLADWLRRSNWPAITPDLRIPYTGDTKNVLEEIAASCGGKVNRMDGVRAEYEDGGWGLARASITEPAITFRFEGSDREQLRSVVDRFLAQIPDLHRQVIQNI